MAGITHALGRSSTLILQQDVPVGARTHPKRGVPGALERTVARARDAAEFPAALPPTGTARRAMDPARLERWADQPWISHPTVGPGGGAPPAQRARAQERWARMRLRGGAAEKFLEDPTRVVELEPHPGVYSLLGPRDAETAPGRDMPGAPRVEFSELLAGPLGQHWPALRFKNEFFARYLPRGPSLQYLEVDPGPMYAISSTAAVGANGLRAREAGSGAVAPSLMAVTRSFTGMAAADDYDGGGGGGGGGDEDGGGRPSASADVPYSSLRRSATAPQGPAGAFSRGTVMASVQPSVLAVTSGADREYDLGRSVGQQFEGPLGAPLHVTSVGVNQAVVSAAGGGARAAALNGALLGRSLPGGGGATLATDGLSGGAVFVGEGASGLAGGSVATVQTVVHPLDAFPATKRLVADEKAAQVDAEHLRRRVLTGSVRRDVLLARRHPHGALGVDHVDNAASAVFGELAARRAAERERMLTEAAAREARILGQSSSVARRGYDVLRPDALELPQTLRVEPGSLGLGDARAARLDGLKIMQDLRRAPDNLPPGQSTQRAVLGQPRRDASDWKFSSTLTPVLSATVLSRDSGARTAMLTRQGSRASFDIVSGAARPAPILSAMAALPAALPGGGGAQQ